MAFFENCVERATALAAACGWLAFGGGLEAAVGVAVGGASLATAVSGAIRRHGPESEKALAAIRTSVREGLEQYANIEGWHISAELEAADRAMERALAACFLDRRSLAESARSPEGFPAAATEIILRKLAKIEPAFFGVDGSQIAKDYATTVINTALNASIENERYFEKLQPHLMIEALRGIGTLDNKVDNIYLEMESIHTTLLEIAQNFRLPNATKSINQIRVELVVNNRGKPLIFYNHELPHLLDRIEYSKRTRRVKFVISGDFEKEFCISVHPDVAKFLDLEKSQKILVVLLDSQTGEPVKGDYYRLEFS